MAAVTGGLCRFGVGATASLGIPVDDGGYITLPYAGPANWYVLGAEQVYIPTGAKVAVAYKP